MKKINLTLLIFSILIGGIFIVKAETLFTRNLYFGISNDPEVTQLQNFLTEQGFYSGPVTGNFFSLTLEGVKRFQQNYGITPVAGYFGPITRTKANEILSSQSGGIKGQPTGQTGVVGSVQSQLDALLQQLLLLQQQLQTATSGSASSTSPDITPPVISNVKVSYLGSYSAAVSWDTDELTKSVLYYDTSNDFLSAKSVNIESFQKSHGYVISGLVKGIKYYCKIEATDESGNTKTSDPFWFTLN